MAGLLARLAALGPYFTVEAHDPRTPAHEPWQPLSALLGSPTALRRRAEQVRTALAARAASSPEAVEFRAAASVSQLGLAARLITPVLGAAVTARAPLPIDPEQARWIPAPGTPFRLSLPEAALARPASPEGSPTLRHARDLLTGPIQALVETTAALSVSPTVLWGNVASAINGAASMIAATHPDLADEAATAGSALLSHPPLAAAYTGAPATGFRRRSCCLIYRIAPATRAFCGDCILLHQPDPVAKPNH